MICGWDGKRVIVEVTVLDINMLTEPILYQHRQYIYSCFIYFLGWANG